MRIIMRVLAFYCILYYNSLINKRKCCYENQIWLYSPQGRGFLCSCTRRKAHSRLQRYHQPKWNRRVFVWASSISPKDISLSTFLGLHNFLSLGTFINISDSLISRPIHSLLLISFFCILFISHFKINRPWSSTLLI